MKTYRIKDWDKYFETSETKKLAYLKWVPVPNKHDGLGFRKTAAHPECCGLFAAWNLILQVASKGHRNVSTGESERGLLQRQGNPLDAQDLSLMTGFPQKYFQMALEFFSSPQIGWLQVDNAENKSETVAHQQPPVKTAEPAEKTAEPPAEWKGMEGNGREEREGTRSLNSFGEIPTVEEVIAFGNGVAAVPEDFCRHYHAKKTETQSWDTRGRIVLWKKEIVRWWSGDRHKWKKSTNGPTTFKTGTGSCLNI